MVEIDVLRHHQHTQSFESEDQMTPQAARPSNPAIGLSEDHSYLAGDHSYLAGGWLPPMARMSGAESITSTPVESRSGTPTLVCTFRLFYCILLHFNQSIDCLLYCTMPG